MLAFCLQLVFNSYDEVRVPALYASWLIALHFSWLSQ